ncbi:MAG TPA: hypothetical protein VFE79_26565 [Paraburkholderia sp.]|nr:hypothetical protein [Paraburkholderia sp.]
MSDFTSYVRLPHTLISDAPLTIASAPIDSDQFAARQVEFVSHLFGYCAYLRDQGRTTPISDAFLPVLVMLLEVLELNSAPDAHRCAAQLSKILMVTFPDLNIDTTQVLDAALAEIRKSSK